MLRGQVAKHRATAPDLSSMMRLLGVIATRGTSNNIFQVATLVRAATALELEVRVLFAQDALAKLRRDALNRPEWSPIYAPVLPELEERLRAADFVDMESFLRDAKEHGDHVSFWADAATLRAHQLDLGDLIPLIDGSLDEAEFRASPRPDVLLEF